MDSDDHPLNAYLLFMALGTSDVTTFWAYLCGNLCVLGHFSVQRLDAPHGHVKSFVRFFTVILAESRIQLPVMDSVLVFSLL